MTEKKKQGTYMIFHPLQCYPLQLKTRFLLIYEQIFLSSIQKIEYFQLRYFRIYMHLRHATYNQ